ncbi:MAG: sulfotransferase family protein [Myxococcales bacterium]|nr:sulfotransferase family protein [Myxococcales bacterium]
MKVIGAGYGRTGTDSLKEAIELLLGGRCYHMKEVLGRPEHLDRWVEFGARGRQGMDWEALFADYVACVDWPAANYYREIMAAFPDAKVLLSVRDPERWYDSLQVLVRISGAFGRLSFIPKFRKFKQMIAQVVWHVFPDVRDRRSTIEVYERHVAEVKAAVPAERLLVFDVRAGWGPLCAFLGVPVPDVPFPHRNTRGEIERFARRNMLREVMASVGWIIVAGLVLAIIIALVFRRG